MPPEPWDDWDTYRSSGLAREANSAESERPVVRSRLVRGTIWFTLAIMPAQERWLGWLLDRPHAVVKTHDRDLGDIHPSLPSRP
jgi:hypothetical protein